jgi:tetratricopeptide (TPR) repeat protein
MKKQLVALSLVALFIVITNIDVKAQRVKRLVKSGDVAFANNNFYGAAFLYKKAILKDSTDIHLHYKYAQASRLNLDYTTADYWYTKVYNEDKQGTLFPECVFWLASVKKIKGNYATAHDLFTEYIQKNKNFENNYLVKKATQEIAACDIAQELVSNPDNKITITHIDAIVNSKLSEYAPYIADSTLYFSSLQFSGGNRDEKNQINYNKLYSSVMESDLKWTPAKEMDTLVNGNNVHTANVTFNADKTKMYVTRCKQKSEQDFSCSIYVSQLKNNAWSPLKKLPDEVNEAGHSSTQPSIGKIKDKEVLFFSSDRTGGEGKIDIWYSKILSDSTYEKPVNAGNKVNSIEDDITPFYSGKNNELFFSSTWHKGLGSFDVFKSTYNDSTFGEPQNMGIPFNSSYSDIYFSTNAINTAAFVSSNRTGSFYEERENCCNDIYMFNIPAPDDTVELDTVPLPAAAILIKDSILAPSTPSITATPKLVAQSVISQNVKPLLPISLYFHNDEPDRQSVSDRTTINYTTAYKKYAAKRKLYKTILTKGKKTEQAIAIKKSINEFFDSLDTGMNSLDTFALMLLEKMKNGEKLTVTIKSYYSPLASDKYNYHLAKRRIYSLRNYFKEYENGILYRYMFNKNVNEGCFRLAGEVIEQKENNSTVSSDFNDVKNSVFNLKAAYTRKVIIDISPSSNPEK